MATMHTYLDQSRRDSLAQDPARQVDMAAAEVAMEALRKAQAAHPDLQRRQMPEPDPLDPDTMTNCTSLQPFGDASVMVCYDDEGSISVTGVDLDDGFVPASEFAAHVVARWERDIAAEVRCEAAMARWER